jgi:hypothetical protein
MAFERDLTAPAFGPIEMISADLRREHEEFATRSPSRPLCRFRRIASLPACGAAEVPPFSAVAGLRNQP